MDKLDFCGIITSIQPRIRLRRSFDETQHTYLGYAIVLEGGLDGENGQNPFRSALAKRPKLNIS